MIVITKKPSLKSVWILTSGEHSSGRDVVAVFNRRPSDSVFLAHPRICGREWKENEVGQWESCNDFLELKEHEVVAA